MAAVRGEWWDGTKLVPTGVLPAGLDSTAGPFAYDNGNFPPANYFDPPRFGFGLWWDKQKEVSTQFYISNNGNITWNGPFTSKTPAPLNTLLNSAFPIFCPFWADINTTSTGTVEYKVPFEVLPSATSGLISSDFYSMGGGGFVVTWYDVPPPNGGPERNTFQIVVHSRNDAGPLDTLGGPSYLPYVDFDVEFNYDKIQWDNGGLFRIGFTSGEEVSGQHYEFPGSGYAGYYLDSNLATGLIHHSHNSTVKGRYLFRFRTMLRMYSKFVAGEGLAQDEEIGDFYNHGLGGSGSGPGPALGIAFSNAKVQIGRSNEPATPSSAIPYAGSGHRSILPTASPMLINIPGGFDREFSCNHYVTGAMTTLKFYSAVNAGGTLLKTINIPITPDNTALGYTRWRTLVTPINFQGSDQTFNTWFLVRTLGAASHVMARGSTRQIAAGRVGAGTAGELVQTWHTADDWQTMAVGPVLDVEPFEGRLTQMFVTPSGAVLLGNNASNPSTQVVRCWRSTDQGTSWSSGFVFEGGSGLPAVMEYWMDSNTSGSVLLAAVTREVPAGGTLRHAECWVSTDDGVTWLSRSTIQSGALGNPGQITGIVFVSGTTWLAQASGGGQYGTWRSTDDGFTWTKVLSIFGTGGYPAFHKFSASAILQQTVDGLKRSTDGGATWTACATPPPSTGAGGGFLRVTDTRGLYLFAGVVYESFDAGNTWASASIIASLAGFQANNSDTFGNNGRAYIIEYESGEIWHSDPAPPATLQPVRPKSITVSYGGPLLLEAGAEPETAPVVEPPVVSPRAVPVFHFLCGFETGHASPGGGGEVVVPSAGASTSSFDTTTKRTGSYALKVPGNGSARFRVIGLTTTFYWRFYIRLTASPAVKILIASVGSSQFSSSGRLHVWLMPTGLLGCSFGVYSSGTTPSATGSTPISTVDWNLIEVKYVVNSTTGGMEIKLNGVVQVSSFTSNTTTGVGTTANYFHMTNQDPVNDPSLAGVDVYFDDIAVTTTEYPGGGGIVKVQGAAGTVPTYDTWTKNGDTTAGLVWSNTPPNLTTNCSVAADAQRQTMVIDSTALGIALPAGAVIQSAMVRVHGRATSFAPVKIMRRVDGVITDSANLSLTLAAAGAFIPEGINDESYGCFTPTRAQLDFIQFGCLSVGTVATTVHDVWLMIDYAPPAVTIAFDSMRFGQYWAGSQGEIPEPPPPLSGCTPGVSPEGSFPNEQEPIPGEIVVAAKPIPGPPIPTVSLETAMEEDTDVSRARRRVKKP